MSGTLIRLSSRALGRPARVRVYVYDRLDDMREAAERFNGNDNSDALGVTQAYYSADGTHCLPIVRLARGHLGTQIVSHEMHHAATALYGVSVGEHARARTHLNHFNEPFAHLYSDLLRRLVDRLYALGYYDPLLDARQELTADA